MKPFALAPARGSYAQAKKPVYLEVGNLIVWHPSCILSRGG